jgi:hypothetical protein
MRIQRAFLRVAALVTIPACLAAQADDAAGKVTTIAARPGLKPVVARIDNAGTIHLLCDSQDGPKYAKSSDGGMAFSDAIPVVSRSAEPAGLEYSAWDMALGKGGRVHVALSTNAWKLKLPQEEWGFFYSNIDPGSSAFPPVRNINRKPSEGFSLAADEKGHVTACWLADRLYANVSNDNGETFGPSVELNKDYNPCNCCTTSAAYGEDGRLAILYREETRNERDMHLVLWDQVSGQMSRTRVSQTLWKVDACPMTYYRVSPTPDGFLAVWPTRGQVQFAQLDRQGKSRPPGEITTPGKSGMRTGVLILNSSEGTFLVAWKSGGRLGWQLYGQDGKPLGDPGSAESPGDGAAGVVSRNGGFILFR